MGAAGTLSQTETMTGPSSKLPMRLSASRGLSVSLHSEGQVGEVSTAPPGQLPGQEPVGDTGTS